MYISPISLKFYAWSNSQECGVTTNTLWNVNFTKRCWEKKQNKNGWLSYGISSIVITSRLLWHLWTYRVYIYLCYEHNCALPSISLGIKQHMYMQVQWLISDDMTKKKMIFINLRSHYLRASVMKTTLITSTVFVWGVKILYVEFKRFPLKFHTIHILPIHWKMCILFTGENVAAFRFKSS